jgi:hypothetical protein
MRWAFSKQSDRQMVNEVSKRFDIKVVVQMGDGSSPGIVSDNTQALVLDDLEFEDQEFEHKNMGFLIVVLFVIIVIFISLVI